MSKSFTQKYIFLFIILSFFISSPLYSASKKKKKTEEKTVAPVQTESVQNENSSESLEDDIDISTNATSIKLPSKKRTYFYKIDQEILKQVEEGSPSSIRSAMAMLRQNTADYEENEKVLMSISADIMKIAYPSEKITWDVLPVVDNNPYSGAIESVKQGIFDSSTGNVDFLTILLPTLVLLRPTAGNSVYEQCQTSLENALSLNPESVLANYLMGVLFEKQGKYSEAEKHISKIYNKIDDNDEITLFYIKVLRENGKLDVASKVLEKMPKDSNDISVLKQNAYIAFDSKDYTSAELYVAKVLQQTPNDLEFVLFRAKILVEKNDYIHAVSLLDMYARQDNSSIDYLVLRARVQLDWSKNTSAATETVEKALQLYPDNIDALMFAARISAVTDSPVAGKYADELAGRVLEKNPNNTEAKKYALDGLIQRENWQEAYNVSKSIIESSTVTPDIVEKYVTICINLNKKTEAYDFAKKYYDMNPNNEILLQSYILAYSQVGNRDAVLKYIGSMLENASPKMKSYLYYRRSYLQLTEENTLADLRSSLISNPRNSDSLFRLYEMYYAKKDYRKAQYYLRQVVAINPNDNSIKQLNEALTKLIQ